MGDKSSSQQGGNRWTEQDVLDYRITNEQLQKKVEAHNPQAFLDGLHRTMGDTPEFANAQRHYDDIMQAIARQEKERGTGKIDIIIGTEIASTSADQTKEGRNFILINEREFKNALLSDKGLEMLQSTLGHEITHVVHGDNAPANAVREHNDRAYSRMAEMRADLEGSGPQGAHNPQGAINFLEDKLSIGLHKAQMRPHSGLENADPNHLTDADYRILSGINAQSAPPDHPSAWDRITALREEASLMAEYERSHTVRTAADRAAEAREVVGAVMRDMRGIILPDPGNEGPAHPAGDHPSTKGGKGALKDSPHAQLEEIRNTMGTPAMQAANDIAPPLAVPSVLPATERAKS